MTTQMITQQDRNRLISLNRMIVNGTATFDDYKEYEILLLNNGYTHNQIKEVLEKGDFHNIREYYQERQRSQDNRQDWEVIVTGGLIALSLALLMYGIANKK
jgi:hypothetical protein